MNNDQKKIFEKIKKGIDVPEKWEWCYLPDEIYKYLQAQKTQ